jgi:serine protease Do
MKHSISLKMSSIYALSGIFVVIALGTWTTSKAEPTKAVLEAESQRVATIEKAKPAVLSVFDSQGRGGGSGVVISSDGYALTNFHVVQPCGIAMKCGMADGRVYDAVLVGIDPTGDVALIKLLGRGDFPFAEIGDSDQVEVGDEVLAMGNPFLLSTNLQPTVTHGIISGVHRYQYPSGTLLEYTDCLQTDASINPGNSGGPLFDAQGRLIGINGRCSFDKRGRVSVGVGYSISINQIKNYLGCLHSGRIVDHATLGARMTTDDQGRVVVAEILEQSDAYRRGLVDNDEVISFAERAITTTNGYKNILGILPDSWRVPLSYRRDGKRVDIMVRLPSLHTQDELLKSISSHEGEEPLPEPKPDDESKPKSKGDKPTEKPGHAKKDHQERKRTLVAETEAEELPDVVKECYLEKRGYANYYFNKLNQDRIWKNWNGRCDLTEHRGSWTISGNLANGGAFTLGITDNGAQLVSPSLKLQWILGDDLSTALEPEHSGGLFAALYLWRRFAIEGLAKFGDVYYWGTAPIVGHDGLADVLVGTHKGAECRFYFDPDDGRMLAIEMFPSDNTDPCEIYFSEYREMDRRMLPGRLVVRFADEIYGEFPINEYRFEKTAD